MTEPMLIEEDTREFIRSLPDLCPLSAHLCMLAVRSRMAKVLLDTKIQDLVVERKIIRPASRNPGHWREVYFEKVYNLATLQQGGHYVYDHIDKGTIIIPHQCMAIFATISPRDVLSAVADVNLATDKQFIALYGGMDPAESILPRLDVEFFAALHRHRVAKSKAHPERIPHKYTTVDLDDASIFEEVRDELTPYKKFATLKTARGYHFILELDGQSGEDFYRGGTGTWPRLDNKHNKGKAKAAIDLLRDAQEPVAGCRYCRPDAPDAPNYVRFVE